MLPLRARFTALTLLATLALALAAAAVAKQTSVTVTRPSASPKAGVPWILTVRVALGGKPYVKPGYRPTLYVVDKASRPVATFHGTLAAPGKFSVRIVFPRPGTWRYVIPDPLNGEWSFAGLRVAAA
jgi:hypothetical protein